ncbi:MAG: hypothetical protein NZ937_09370 [Armatimonadetes bacterium]|nr:hypothetical protein [Armatimonadota bacterium]
MKEQLSFNWKFVSVLSILSLKNVLIASGLGYDNNFSTAVAHKGRRYFLFCNPYFLGDYLI